MIILNGVKFAATKREFTDSLFQSGGTCSGTYKVRQDGVHLYDAQGERIGGINRHGVLYQSAKVRGRYRHQPVTPKLIGGLESPFKRTREEAHQALRDHGFSI